MELLNEFLEKLSKKFLKRIFLKSPRKNEGFVEGILEKIFVGIIRGFFVEIPKPSSLCTGLVDMIFRRSNQISSEYFLKSANKPPNWVIFEGAARLIPNTRGYEMHDTVSSRTSIQLKSLY